MTEEEKTDNLGLTEFMATVGDHLRRCEEVGIGHRNRLIEAGIDEHIADHLSARVIAELSEKFVFEPLDRA